MARPRKKGIDYFPLDCSFVMDIDIRVLRNRFGNDGPMVYLYIISKAYETNGYYVEYNDDLICIISADMQISEEKVEQIIEHAISRKLLVMKTHNEKSFLTSAGIQKRYAQACNYRVRSSGLIPEIWIIESLKNGQDELLEFCCPNVGVLLDDNPYIKVNENKLNKTIIKESKENADAVFITLSEKDELISLYGEENVDDAIKKAYASTAHPNEPYIRKILENWKKDGKIRLYNADDLYG